MTIQSNNIEKTITNKELLHYASIYQNIAHETTASLEQFGLPLSNITSTKENYFQKVKSLKDKGALIRNNQKSIVSNNRISTACEACQTGKGSYTSFISTKCHRDCYFCFNKNQDDYHFYLQNQRKTNDELIHLVKSGIKITHLALTGGEPLLHPKETIEFFSLANEISPHSHTRLYTAGDLLNEELLQKLKESSLDEIRFSIKLEDSKQKQKHILNKISLATQYIPSVMVEMPIIPGTDAAMKQLLLDLDQIGVYGINLLEFCFPINNVEAFRERNMTLKNPPYDIYYNFWYAGGLAIAESEELCLELVDYAIDHKLKLGVHYCSLENKFTGQIYQQNHNVTLDETYHFSNRDYYFKTAKVFGKDIKKVESVLKQANRSFISNTEYQFLQFPLDTINLLKNEDIDILISFNVVENEDGKQNIREVHLEHTTPQYFQFENL